MWYFAIDGQSQGPISEADLDARVQSGAIPPDTFIWREGMASWLPYNQVRGQASSSPQPLRVSIPSAAAPAYAAPAAEEFEPEPVVASQGSTRLESVSSWGMVVVVLVAMFLFIGMLASRSHTRDRAPGKPLNVQNESGDTETVEAKVALRAGTLSIRNNSSFDWPATTISFRSGKTQYFHNVDQLARDGSLSIPLNSFTNSVGDTFSASTQPKDFVLSIKGFSNMRVRLSK
jgi:hypothetical protein